MNIFEEIVESYTYNGAVSLKALEDDIVTLENQIDSYNATLREVRLRGKKSLPLVQKIRDAKMRLSLLKAVYRRESDKATPDDVIINMLGLSAKNAKETEAPGTAADKKEPVPQNFEKAEIEIVDDNEDLNAIEGDMATDEEIVVENVGLEEETKDDVTIEADSQEDALPDAQLETITEDDYKAVEEITKKDNEYPTVSHKDDTMVEHNVVKPEISFDKESGIVTISKTPESHCEYFIPKNEKNEDEDKNTIEMEKFKVSDDVYDLTKATKEELDEFYATLTNDDTVFVLKDGETVEMENEAQVSDCPPPTIDDYLEPVDNQEMSTFYDDTCESYTENPQCHDDEVQDYNSAQLNSEAESKDRSVVECETDISNDFDVYEAFQKEKVELVASVDLSYVTDMVNTMRVYGQIDHNRRLLNIRFVDVRDYEVFVKLLKERDEERHNPFKLLFKKPRSIFIYMAASVGDSSQKYKFEFTRCRIKNVFDSEYTSKVGIPFEDSSYHDCGVTFKYKKLIIT